MLGKNKTFKTHSQAPQSWALEGKALQAVVDIWCKIQIIHYESFSLHKSNFCKDFLEKPKGKDTLEFTFVRLISEYINCTKSNLSSRKFDNGSSSNK